MKDSHHEHLGDEQILWAVIDTQELSEYVRAHVLTCGLCQDRVKQFRGDLEEFGVQVRQAVPPLSRPIRVPALQPLEDRQKIGHWLPFFGAVAMAGLVVFFYFMGLKTVTPVQYAAVQEPEIQLEDETLMREITDLVEYPLPGDIYEIIGVNGTDYEDDYMDFDVLDAEDDFQS